MASLDKGNEIVTAGGIVGQINKVEDDFVKVQVAANMEMRIQKSAVGATLPKGTIKSRLHRARDAFRKRWNE